METKVRGNVGFLIWRVSMRWRAATDRALAPVGLTHAQYSVLAPLLGMSASGARPSQRELADFTGLDPVYVSKLVRALEREGFLTRSVKVSDRLTAPLGGNAGARTAELAQLLLELVDAPEADG
jgi:MarR family transcriptional regulator, organic hydroperoxide resistance regulator